MRFTVYDYRNPDHIKNLLVTPEMRSRILKMEPGQGFNSRHSHDLGHEILLTFDSDAFTVRTHLHPLAEVDFKRGNPWGKTLTRIVFIAKQPKLVDRWEWKIEKN